MGISDDKFAQPIRVATIKDPTGTGSITINTSGTLTMPNATTTIVGRTTTDTLTNKTLTSPSMTSPSVTSGNLAMSGGKITGLASGTTSGDVLQYGQIGAVNGIAGLDGSGKVPYAQLPSALMTYKGAWDPTDVVNTLTSLDASPINGDVFRASVDGVAVSGNGAVTGTTFYAGDFAIYNGTAWQRSPLADGVISVNGSTGAVTVNAINQLTGDVTTTVASGSQSKAATLATVNSNVGTFGTTAAKTASVTVNAKGLVTAASEQDIAISANTQLTGTTLASSIVTSSLTAVGTLTTGTWSATTIAVNKGGTGQTTYTDGQLLIGNTSGNTLTKATLTAGTGISITNGNGSITVASNTGSAGDIAETSFSAANNVSSPANVTGLAFANGTVRSFKALVSVFINATSSLYEVFELRGIQKGSDWDLSFDSTGDTSGIAFTITTAGQVQYTSTNVSGFTADTMKFRAQTTTV